MIRRRGAVFVTYNGLLDPLGPSQILPYVERLHATWPMRIISFERADRLADHAAVEGMEQRMARTGVRWTRLRYHKRPSLLATTYDLMQGAVALRYLIETNDIGLVHCRGYVPAAIAFRATRRVPVLFDIRGLQAEEYVDGGVWKKGELKWQLAKRSERAFFRKASGAVVLTENIRPHVEGEFRAQGRLPPLEVIPCCTDLERFRFDEDARVALRAKLAVPDDATLLLYSGSLGTWYLADEMARLARAYRDETGKKTILLWLVNNDADAARAASRAAGLGEDEIRVTSAKAAEVAGYLSAADASLALIKASFSKRSSSPTKYAECLAAGLPLVISRDVGDGAILGEKGVAVSMTTYDDASMRAATRELSTLIGRPRAEYARVARELFDVDAVALPRYRRLYEALVLP
jgi:glycosyltransferase involved in cell wall biosynthesis